MASLFCTEDRKRADWNWEGLERSFLRATEWKSRNSTSMDRNGETAESESDNHN